jgi:hypothetical protein
MCGLFDKLSCFLSSFLNFSSFSVKRHTSVRQVHKNEMQFLRSKFLTAKFNKSRVLPKAFTEKGLTTESNARQCIWRYETLLIGIFFNNQLKHYIFLLSIRKLRIIIIREQIR